MAWKAAGRFMRYYFTEKMTVMYDIPKLGIPRQDCSRISGTAVIIGGSIAGLWTARVCADHFEDVLIVEPEAWVTEEKGMELLYDDKGNRKDDVPVFQRQRVPQYTTIHAYQPIQIQALRRLLPEFLEEIQGGDGRLVPCDYNMHSFGGHILRMPFHKYEDKELLDIIFVSRDSYERLLRRLVLQSSKRVRWVTGTATGIKTNSDPSVLNSVLVRAAGGEKEIPASLVIDCSGPTQVGLKWIKRIYNTEALPARHESIPFDDLKLEYRTGQRYQMYRIYVPPDVRPRLPIPGGYDKAGAIYAYIPRPGLEKWYFLVSRAEGHRIEFLFSGWSDPLVPKSIFEIKDYLSRLNEEQPLPCFLFEMMDILLEHKAEAESGVQFLPSVSWVRYEHAPYIPSNYIAIGDSVMRANPAFGQGFSKAAMGAITLDSILRSPRYFNSSRIPKDFGREFFKKHSDRISGVWSGTKPMDYQWDSTVPVKGEKLSDADFMAGYGSIAWQLSLTDDKINAALWGIRCFLAPPTALLHPYIIARVAIFWLKRRFLGI